MTTSIQPTNYVAHAIDDFLANAPLIAQGNPRALKSIFATVDQLRRSEKFILPEDGRLLGIDALKDHFPDLLRLPYPLVALEFPTTAGFNGGSHKNILLCWTGGDLIDPRLYRDVVASDQESEIICFTSIFWSDRQRAWLPSPFAFWFHRECLLPANRENRTQWHVGVVESACYLDFLAQMPEEQYDLEADLNLKVGMDVILEFCLTVNCENVEQAQLPAPKLINRKRIAKGREPFYSYRFLTIPGHNDRTVTAGGSHSSPRLHLRRGHLRRLASGKVTWVRHTMVGNSDIGVVEKSYSVSVKN